MVGCFCFLWDFQVYFSSFFLVNPSNPFSRYSQKTISRSLDDYIAETGWPEVDPNSNSVWSNIEYKQLFLWKGPPDYIKDADVIQSTLKVQKNYNQVLRPLNKDDARQSKLRARCRCRSSWSRHNSVDNHDGQEVTDFGHEWPAHWRDSRHHWIFNQI